MTSQRRRDPSDWDKGLLKAVALPDGAFKLYIWLRLNARIDTGSLQTSQLDLARALGKAPGTIRANLQILETAGVCRMEFGRNPHVQGRIEIADDYWPYGRIGSPTEDPELQTYLDRIHTMLSERACVRNPLSQSDELMAREWYARGIPAERVEQAILMGCGRKYVSWRNGAPRVPIGSLRYFESILAELEQQPAPPEYWDYTRHRIERMEKLWRKGKEIDDRTGSDNLACKPENGRLSRHGPAPDR